MARRRRTALEAFVAFERIHMFTSTATVTRNRRSTGRAGHVRSPGELRWRRTGYLVR
jgi:hypothetical protein